MSKTQRNNSTDVPSPTKWERFKLFFREHGVVILVFQLVLLIWLSNSLFIQSKFWLEKEIDWAEVGDSYGWLTSFFTALAFAGLLYTIILQRKELHETRDEFKTQNVTLKRQRFETTFFNMLSIHFKLLEDVKHMAHIRDDLPKTLIKGIDAFLSFNSELKLHINRSIKTDNLAEMPKLYSNYNGEHRWYFAPYVSSLVALLRVIVDSKFNEEDGAEKRYISVLKSYISLPEMIFLSYQIVLTENQDLRKLDSALQIVLETERAKEFDPMLNMYIDMTDNTYKQQRDTDTKTELNN